MTTITAIITFLLGAAIGSFLSVVIFRMHKRKKGIILSRSVCPYCKKKLKWHHLFPIFSWIFLGGKCGYCGKKISVHYLMLEIFTGMIFLLTFLNWNFIITIPSTIDPNFLNYGIDWKIFETFIFYIIEFSFLAAIFFYDLLYKEIPDKFSLPAIGIALAGGLVLGTPAPIDMILGGGIIFLFFAAQFVLSRGKWIGGGDLRLGALIGILLGWKAGLLALIISYIIGATVSIILLLQGKVNKKTAIPFGPFLVTGAIIAVFYGNQIVSWYLETLSI